MPVVPAPPDGCDAANRDVVGARVVDVDARSEARHIQDVLDAAHVHRILSQGGHADGHLAQAFLMAGGGDGDFLQGPGLRPRPPGRRPARPGRRRGLLPARIPAAMFLLVRGPNTTKSSSRCRSCCIPLVLSIHAEIGGALAIQPCGHDSGPRSERQLSGHSARGLRCAQATRTDPRSRPACGIIKGYEHLCRSAPRQVAESLEGIDTLPASPPPHDVRRARRLADRRRGHAGAAGGLAAAHRSWVGDPGHDHDQQPVFGISGSCGPVRRVCGAALLPGDVAGRDELSPMCARRFTGGSSAWIPCSTRPPGSAKCYRG